MIERPGAHNFKEIDAGVPGLAYDLDNRGVVEKGKNIRCNELMN